MNMNVKEVLNQTGRKGKEHQGRLPLRSSHRAKILRPSWN